MERCSRGRFLEMIKPHGFAATRPAFDRRPRLRATAFTVDLRTGGAGASAANRGTQVADNNKLNERPAAAVTVKDAKRIVI